MNIKISNETKDLKNLDSELFPAQLQALLKRLHREFEPRRQALMAARETQQAEYNAGKLPSFLKAHPARMTSWQVGQLPKDLLDRRVEITGPVSNLKMVINMLSENQDGEMACTAMLDFEDSMAPTWENVTAGIKNVIGVAYKNLTFTQGQKVYSLNPKKMAHPMVRVRGLHMTESHFVVDEQAISAGLFDLAVTAFHTAKVFLADNKTPKFYIPKCEHYLEAKWWNEVMTQIEHGLELPQASLRVTFLIETLPASFQMEEILYEIRERACGLNGGRWDKIFSDIKTLRMHQDRILANRSSIDMTRPWMDNYAKLLVKTCHKHGAFAMGGMSAFTPGKDPETRQIQIDKVIADKKREVQNGHDGCWVSHPYFIRPAKEQFQKKNQLSVLLEDFSAEPDLLPQASGPKTLEGLRQNIRVGIVYQQGWDQGIGCVSFENLMEDLATLEISRAQVWQWLYHRVKLDDGTEVNPSLIERIFEEELQKVIKDLELAPAEQASYQEAKEKIKKLFLRTELVEFFTTQ
jgi:malate synthase